MGLIILIGVIIFESSGVWRVILYSFEILEEGNGT
jgi:hypothetical protein